MAALSTQEAVNGLTTVTSQTNKRPTCHGIKVSPSRRFPSCLSSPEGSLTAGIPAAPKARQTMSLLLFFEAHEHKATGRKTRIDIQNYGCICDHGVVKRNRNSSSIGGLDRVTVT